MLMAQISFRFQNVGEVGIKTKYLSSEYKKPLCFELENVKISRVSEDDLETTLPRQSTNTRLEWEKKRSDDERAEIKWMRESSTKFLNYLQQFLPPAAMILTQVQS
jgi:hypothetical protein